MKSSAIVLSVLVTLCVPLSAHSTTWYVIQDSSGDATTIQAGIDLAAVGDTVLVAAGTYTGGGNKDLDFGGKDVVLLGEAGPEVTIIDCEGAWGDSTRGFYFHSGETPAAVVEGLTVTGGYVMAQAPGGGVYCENSSPTFVDCIFLENTAEDLSSGGGIYGRNSSPTLRNCSFISNRAGWGSYGGAAYFDSSSPTFLNCSVVENLGIQGGGAFYLRDSDVVLEDCTLAGNVSAVGGGGIHSYGGSLSLTGCLFSNNESDVECSAVGFGGEELRLTNCTLVGNLGPGIRFGSDVSPVLKNTIIAFSVGGQAIWCNSGSPAPSLTCCDLYSNEGGDWVGCIADQHGVNGNISEDPLFCGEVNYPSDPYRLDIASPCARRHAPCFSKLIGARGTGCSGAVATEPTTWGRVKAMYR